MTVLINSIIPALGLSKMTDSEINVYALERINSLTLNKDSFPGLDPDAAAVAVKQKAYSDALQNQVKGNKSSTLAKNEARVDLEKILTLQAQNCAEIADGDEVVYLLSGYGIKSKSQPSGQLNAPAAFTVKNGSSSGSIVSKFKGVKGAHGYEMRVKDTEGKTVATGYSSSSPINVTELAPLKVYTVMARAIGAKGKKGDWTNEITISVI